MFLHNRDIALINFIPFVSRHFYILGFLGWCDAMRLIKFSSSVQFLTMLYLSYFGYSLHISFCFSTFFSGDIFIMFDILIMFNLIERKSTDFVVPKILKD